MGWIGLGVSIAVLLFFISIPIADWLWGLHKASKSEDNEDDIINKLLK